MNTKKTLEEKVSETILQETREIIIGGKKYAVGPIFAGTLVRMSALISKLPSVPKVIDGEAVFRLALHNAGALDILAGIAATGVLNRKDLSPVRKPGDRWRFWESPAVVLPGVEQLKEEILYSFSPKQISTLILDLIGRSELADFFGVMVSLSGVNLLKETGMNGTTVCGPLSEE